MTFVGLEPQWYIAQLVVFTTRPLVRCWKPSGTYSTYFCLAWVTNIRHISSHKITFAGLEPQWYITQPLVITTRLPARSRKPIATYSPYFFFSTHSKSQNYICRTWTIMVHYTAWSRCHCSTCSLFQAYPNLFTLFFSLACIIKIHPLSNPKMTSVGIEPQWYIIQPVVSYH
jgi:hypothetical protein